MKSSLLVLASLLALASAEEQQFFRKQVDAGFVDKQEKILDIFSGILTHNLDSKYNHDHQDFTFEKPELFTNPKVLEGFMRDYKKGFLPRDGVFTMNNYRSRHETFKIFELMYFAKDFDTFMEIAKWCKNELNPLQFSYAFTVAIFHRADCRGIYVPPLYELHPHYFVPSDVMRQVDIAALHDVKFRVFEVNNTGYEYSYYRDMISGSSKSHSRWVGDDLESRISYFREDPSLGHWYALFMARWATWLSPTKHTGVNFFKRGKTMNSAHKWILSRYNLERMSADLPFVVPFDSEKPVIGYNPKLADHFGHPFIPRPDGMIPFKANPDAFNFLDLLEKRIYEAIDSNANWDYRHQNISLWTEETGSDIIGKIFFGERDGIGRYYYKPWFFIMLEAINDMTHSSNDREYTNTVFGKYMTVLRDPVFYQVVASMDDWFQTYFKSLPPYTPEQLNFPGVKVLKVEFDKLMTYFERWEYDITQGAAFKKPEDKEDKKYLASHFRLNHKPFHFNITVESDRAQDSLVRIFFGPKKNIDQNDMSLNQARHAFFLGAFYPEKLKAGVNVISRSSKDLYYYENYEPLKTFKERIAKSKESGKPFKINPFSNCGVPSNLLLPGGAAGGREYSAFVMIEPFNAEGFADDQDYYQCGAGKFMNQKDLTYPFDRHITFPKKFVQPNMFFQDINIFHKFESDLNRPHSF